MSRASVTHISGGWGSRATSSASCREALVGVLAGDREPMAMFVGACSDGLLALRELGQPMRRELLERRHRYETHGEQLEETLSALYDLAHKLMPLTPGAALGHLRERVVQREGEPLDAVEAIEQLIAGDRDSLDLILEAARRGSDEYVIVATRHIYGDLYCAGQRWTPGNFSTHVRQVMATLCPPAWDEAWVISERRRASLYIISRAADEDLPYLNAEYAELFAAEDAHDTTRYSTAIRALVKAGLTTLHREGRLLAEPASVPAVEPDRSTNEGSSSAA